MLNLTRYLSVHSDDSIQWSVSVADQSPLVLLQNALGYSGQIRYSPILPAYLVPNQGPPAPPQKLTSIAFFFSRSPYVALGRMKPELEREELDAVHFTQGLASIVCLNCSLERARQMLEHMDLKSLEYWPLNDGIINVHSIVIDSAPPLPASPQSVAIAVDPAGDIAVHVEQILASLVTLRRSYAIYNPAELRTIDCAIRLTQQLVRQHEVVIAKVTDATDRSIANQRRCNSIVSALAEISASLSYAVTQGTSGCSPILANPSPFPHFSLLGVGGAVRALTKFTRYLECAFRSRDVSDVIEKGFSCRPTEMPVDISTYKSGTIYKFDRADGAGTEEFDRGGDFHQQDDVPLISYFSARHGFKESKFAVTAAAESLTAEVCPQWTMMTLSHEIMHSRVREIFQTLFGSGWDQERDEALSQEYYADFKQWYESGMEPRPHRSDCAIRNAVLNFCVAMDRALDIPQTSRRTAPERNIDGLLQLSGSYRRHKLRAVEIFVHFHDYYFSYACQPMMYTMSLWASWLRVAAPYARPQDYLVRSLATIACGTGLDPDAAFEQAKEVLEDGLSALERAGMQSALFGRLRDLLGCQKTYALFKPYYYLIDQVRRFFASREVAQLIDRIEDDPFAEGSTSVQRYSANVFVYGENGDNSFVSPIRYSVASFLRTLLGSAPIKDRQWLTAWNMMVVSSQEPSRC